MNWPDLILLGELSFESRTSASRASTLSEDGAQLVQVVHEQLFVLVVHARVVRLLERHAAILQELLDGRGLGLLSEQTRAERAEGSDGLRSA